MEILYASGMRVTACVSLRFENFKFDCPDCDMNKIEKSKGRHGGHERTFFILPLTLAKVKKFGAGRPTKELLFDISTRQVQRNIKEAAIKVLGFEKGSKFHPHSFRHHFATHWYDNGLAKDTLRDLMGHA